VGPVDHVLKRAHYDPYKLSRLDGRVASQLIIAGGTISESPYNKSFRSGSYLVPQIGKDKDERNYGRAGSATNRS
jgi:hypothetical protein